MSKRSRYFPNIYQVKEQEIKETSNLEREIENSSKLIEETLKRFVEKIVKSSPPKHTGTDGGLYVGSAGISYAFLHLSQRKTTKTEDHSVEYLKLAQDYLKSPLQNFENSHQRNSSFLLGDSGIIAIAASLSKTFGNDDNVSKFVQLYLNFSEPFKKIDYLPFGSDEFFVGRTGYLFGALWLNKQLQNVSIPPEIMHPLCHSIVQSGYSYSRKNSSSCPLMYSYYDTEYLGAAHGLSSILQVLIQVPEFLDSDSNSDQLVRNSVDYLLSLETPSGNFPCALDEITSPRSEDQELIHWCHGAPGVIYLMAVAHQRWKDQRYLDCCFRIGELVWQRGLLKKGPGICHGIAGNGYVFLLLYRLTSNQLYLYRALKFAEFLNESQFLREARKPDSPYSLYEGLAGTACFLADLLEPQKSAFPFQDIFQ